MRKVTDYPFTMSGSPRDSLARDSTCRIPLQDGSTARRDGLATVRDTQHFAERTVVCPCVYKRQPLYFPGHLHGEVLRSEGDTDLIERWVVDGGAVRGWRVRRGLDADALRITFEHDRPQPPLTRMLGEWTIEARGDAGSAVSVRHTFTADGDDPGVLAGVAAGLDRAVPRQLGQTAQIAEDLPGLRRRTVRQVLSETVDADLPAVYKVLLDAAADSAGRFAHTGLPDTVVVYKQISGLDPRFATVTGQFRLSDTPAGVTVKAVRSVVLSPAPAGPEDPAAVRDELAASLATTLRGLRAGRATLD